eukprot:g6434.t1
MRPPWQALRGGRDPLPAACTDRSRHVTIVRYSSSAPELQWLKDMRNYTFTIYDKRNGADGFRAAFGPAPNGVVVPQPNQGDEAAAYLARIVDHFDMLSATEIFAHESELRTPEGRHLLHMADRLAPNIAYLPLKRPLFTMLQPTPVGRKRRPWGNEQLDALLWRVYWWIFHGQARQVRGRWSTQCCGQFATSRHRIRHRPLAFWQHLRAIADDALLTTYRDTKRYNNGRIYFFYGHLFERLWGVMLGQTPVGGRYEALLAKEEQERLPRCQVSQVG